MCPAAELFRSLGSGEKASLLNVVIIGVVFVCATVVAIPLVDRLGRRILLFQGDIQMIISFVVVTIAMGVSFNKVTGDIANSSAILIIVFQCIFTAGFGWSWGCLGWLVRLVAAAVLCHAHFLRLHCRAALSCRAAFFLSLLFQEAGMQAQMAMQS